MGNSTIYEITKSNLEMIDTAINDIGNAYKDSPLRDRVDGFGKKISKTGDDIMNGIKNSTTNAILLGGTVVLAIVNQSKFNWAGIEDRPAKRMKK